MIRSSCSIRRVVGCRIFHAKTFIKIVCGYAMMKDKTEKEGILEEVPCHSCSFSVKHESCVQVCLSSMIGMAVVRKND